MHKFYLNECLLTGISEAQFVQYLSATLKELNKLLQKNIGIDHLIVTGSLPSESFYGNSYTLQSVIEKIPDNDLRNLAFGLFYKYPIHGYFDDNYPELLENDYYVTLSGVEHDALNLAIIALNHGYLFTLGISNDICVQPLPILIKQKVDTHSVDNLFGTKENTDAIEKAISIINASKQDYLERLKTTLGTCRYSKQFERDFDRLTNDEQKSVVDYFEQAISREFKTKLYPDTKIIKDVTPEKYKCSVYELRIYRPSAIRVYFNEGVDVVCLASIGFKNDDNQSQEIKAAHTILNKLTLIK